MLTKNEFSCYSFSQALHFFVGLGALLSPLIADPFLSDTDCVFGNSSSNSSTKIWHLSNKLTGWHVYNVSHVQLQTEGEVVTNVSYAFWIMALINVRQFLKSVILNECVCEFIFNFDL